MLIKRVFKYTDMSKSEWGLALILTKRILSKHQKPRPQLVPKVLAVSLYISHKFLEENEVYHIQDYADTVGLDLRSLIKLEAYYL